MKSLIKISVMPLLVGIIGCFLLLLVSLIPQSAIQQNASQSANELVSQPQWMIVLNNGDSSYMMDNYTDSQIIMQSYNLTFSNPESILSNPKHISKADDSNMALALNEVVNNGAENETNYVRYWLGFRVFIRPLLLIGSYFDIRKIVAFTFYLLLSAALVAIAKKVNTGAAICFGVAVALVNPSIVAQSLQFSCTFILSFLFILYICCSKRSNIRYEYVFCIFGILTQFFDFYTSPVITWGIPLLVLLVMDSKNPKPIFTVLKTGLSWAYGYLAMWLTKWLLATVFTDINAFADGFLRVAERTGMVTMEGAEGNYGVMAALKAVWLTLFPLNVGKIILCTIILVTLICIVIIYRKLGIKTLINTSLLLGVAAVPIVWFALTAQPTYIHAWFQYRSITVTFFGLLLFTLKAIKTLVNSCGLKKIQPNVPENS